MGGGMGGGAHCDTHTQAEPETEEEADGDIEHVVSKEDDAAEQHSGAHAPEGRGFGRIDASRRGVQYEVANGQRFPNRGEKQIQGYTHLKGFARSVTAQVCDVKKPLMSVHKLVKAGHKVVFDEPGAYIEHKTTGERIWLQETGGMYMMKLWVRASGTDAGF